MADNKEDADNYYSQIPADEVGYQIPDKINQKGDQHDYDKLKVQNEYVSGEVMRLSMVKVRNTFKFFCLCVCLFVSALQFDPFD